MWQDTLIAVCQAGFIIAFIPTLRGKDKPPVSTSLMTGTLIAIISFALATLRLWFAFATAAIISVLWFTIAVQKIKLDKSSNQQKVLK